MRTRRWAFATPLVVVVGCAPTPPPDHPRVPEPTELEPLEPPPPPPRVYDRDRDLELVAPIEDLVDDLPHLERAGDLAEDCARGWANCNPPEPDRSGRPPPRPRRPPEPPATEHRGVRVNKLMRGPNYTRVRFWSQARADLDWTATFDDEHDVPVVGGTCLIVAVGEVEVECVTHLSPEQIAPTGLPRTLTMTPPSGIAQPPPEARPSPTLGAHIIGIETAGDARRFTLDVGADRRVTLGWIGLLGYYGDHHQRQHCRVVSVAERTTICVARASDDELRHLHRIDLVPDAADP